ncbi:MAG: hypothetical protein FJ154_00955 [Gammaproteobacteria bacterium]|nr:hypothetical protein [Gammaproteobacteria bacterium]
MINELQTEMLRGPRGRIMVMDSAYHIGAANRDRDVVVNASYCGVLPARFIGRHRPRGTIGVDCAVGPMGAAIAGLWYLEALNIPAAVAAVDSVLLGNGVDLYEHGLISFANRSANDCGVVPHMRVHEAACQMLEQDPCSPDAAEVTNRVEVARNEQGRTVICVDSIAFGDPVTDACSVLVTAGHTGRSALPYLLKVRPWGFICSDGGMGRERSGVAGMVEAGRIGIPGAAVDARRARMGDGRSTYEDGIISAANELAIRAGVHVGQSAREAARLLLNFEH